MPESDVPSIVIEAHAICADHVSATGQSAKLERMKPVKGIGGERVKSSEPNWSVYILRCSDGSFYTGISNDPARRFKQHNAGTASRYTRSRLPVELVYQEAQTNRSLALKREVAIKALSRQKKQLLIRDAAPQSV